MIGDCSFTEENYGAIHRTPERDYQVQYAEIDLTGNYEFYYAAGLIAKLSGVEIPEDIKPEELLALLSEQIPMLTPADEKEKYLFGMVADYRPEDVYDEQMRELLDWGRTEKYLWTVTLPDDWQNA